jgi:membrane associated rhomboid family serine protease
LLHHVGEQFAGGAIKHFELRGALADRAGQVLAHHRLEQLFLAGEIQEQRTFGHAGAHGHLFGAGGRIALFHEQVKRRLQQFAGASLLAAFAFVRFQNGRSGNGFSHRGVVND